MRRKIIFILACLMMLSNLVYAGVPTKINYRGKLLLSGLPVNETKNMRFRIWDSAANGIRLWSSGEGTWVSISISGGVFNHTLGLVNAIPVSIFTNDELYLEIEIEGIGIMDPREQLVSVGFSFNADMVDGMHVGQTGSNFIVYANDNGNVGIGTSNPGYKLEVNGPLRLVPGNTPSTQEGAIYYDATDKKLKYRNDKMWVAMDPFWTVNYPRLSPETTGTYDWTVPAGGITVLGIIIRSTTEASGVIRWGNSSADYNEQTVYIGGHAQSEWGGLDLGSWSSGVETTYYGGTISIMFPRPWYKAEGSNIYYYSSNANVGVRLLYTTLD